MKITCWVCPHKCKLGEGQVGICRARINSGGKIISQNYGMITGKALDPIEKKPLYHFYPGMKIFSIGSYGCNLRCSFCQNHEISMVEENKAMGIKVEIKEIIKHAKALQSQGNIGIAYTYNEPLIGYEFVSDCAKEAKKEGLKNVVVTNGFICEDPLRDLLPYIDAFNIDLKGYTSEYYQELRGDLEVVKKSIEIAASKCHVEVTTLIVPGKNDREDEIDEMSRWIASISPHIPLHISRFFPRWEMQDRGATPVKTVYRMAEIAGRYLKNVHVGNV